MRRKMSRSLTRRSMIASGLKSGILLACPSMLWGQDNVAVEPQPYTPVSACNQALASRRAALLRMRAITQLAAR